MIEDIEDPLRQLVEENFLERTRRALRSQVSGASAAMIADAVAAATVQLVEQLRIRQIENLGGYFFKTAKNELVRFAKDAARHRPLTQSVETSRPSIPVESELVYRFLMNLVDAWPAQREGDVVRLVLEAAHEGVDLDTAEYLDHFEDATGQTITTKQFYDLKSRGLRRLRRDLEALASEDDMAPQALVQG